MWINATAYIIYLQRDGSQKKEEEIKEEEEIVRPPSLPDSHL
jgi:hypothetical protein